MRSVYQRFAGDGLEVVYLGPFETEDACRAWAEEYGFEFPVLTDADGSLFRALTNGWVPWCVLLDPLGKVHFSENEFDGSTVARAVQQMYDSRTPDPPH
jgi:hypothetical protein